MDPLNADVAYIDGLCSYYHNGHLSNGLKCFEKAIESEPDHEKARAMQIKATNLNRKMEMGDNLFNVGHYENAHSIYTEPLAIDPLNANINLKLYASRALTNFIIGNIQNAIDDCSHALQINGNFVEILELRIRCYERTDNHMKCVADYEAAKQIKKPKKTEQPLTDVKNDFQRKMSRRYRACTFVCLPQFNLIHTFFTHIFQPSIV